MTITPAKLTRAAGFSALLAGLLYMFVQIIHPHEDVTQVVDDRPGPSPTS